MVFENAMKIRRLKNVLKQRNYAEFELRELVKQLQENISRKAGLEIKIKDQNVLVSELNIWLSELGVICDKCKGDGTIDVSIDECHETERCKKCKGTGVLQVK